MKIIFVMCFLKTFRRMTSVTSFDDSDYSPNTQNNTCIIEQYNQSSSDEVGDDVEVLNLDDNIIYVLPNPIKTRSGLRVIRNKNVNDPNKIILRSRRNIFPSTSPPVLSNQEPILPQPNLNEDHVSSKFIPVENESVLENNLVSNVSEFNFVEPIWCTPENVTLSTPPFKNLEGPTDKTDILFELTPLTIFKLLFTNEVIEHITFHTNLYAQQKYQKFGKPYEPTTIDEISLFIGMNLLMGVKKQCSYRDYWSSAPDLNNAHISSLMPVNRFSWLLSNLHLNDNSSIPKKGEDNYDKIYKVRPFLNFILKNSQLLYNPNKIIAIDESMIKFKGRNSAKQYLPKKPIKRGYKVWALADKNGYLWNFELYTGKSRDLTEKNLGARDIKHLSQPLQNKNHNLYFDNYFTSYPLM